MIYQTVFEITHEAIPLWVPFMPIFFALFGVIFFLMERDAVFFRTLVRGLILVFLCVPTALVTYYFLDQRKSIQDYRSGKYKLVEGQVEHYSWIGKSECFSLHGIEFCHGTANPVGWEPPLRVGPTTWPPGIIGEGLPVRVAYMGDHYPRIVRMDIGRITGKVATGYK